LSCIAHKYSPALPHFSTALPHHRLVQNDSFRQMLGMRFVPQVVCRFAVAFALSSGVLVASASQSDAASPPAAPPQQPTVAAPSPRFLVGSARVLDGDTIDLATREHGIVRIRLEGIDAPEGGQRCSLRWYGTWDCGRAATTALTQIVRDRTVTCDDRGPDKYGRTLSICMIDNRDINAEMVRIGLAWAYVRYSSLYVTQEKDARDAKAGVWQAATQAPWDWRAAQKSGQGSPQAAAQPQPLIGKVPAQPAQAQPAQATADQRPQGCNIKGNVTKGGRIYHTPESPWYERVKMSLGFGRRWFCSETEAQAAGWRPAVSAAQP
jgi:endonuclease YncB( thermonuclease family)